MSFWLEIPVPLLEKKTQWLDVFPSEGVELSCKIKENTGWIFTWHKNAEVLSENTFTTSEKETLSISNASPSHRGNYSCSGKLKGRSVISKNSAEVTLHVYGEMFALEGSCDVIVWSVKKKKILQVILRK